MKNPIRVGLILWAVFATSIAVTYKALNHKPAERYVEVATQVAPKVVTIHVRVSRTVKVVVNGKETEEKQFAGVIGSGVYISPEGHILTAAHVVSVPYKIESITVEEDSGWMFPAVILYKEEKRDLALLKIERVNAPYATIVRPGSLTVGQEVIAVGAALGLSGTVTTGIISAINRNDFGYDQIQMSAPINPGNSGGPLFNLSGEIVGINIFIISESPFPTWSGIGFSVSPSEINRFLVKFKSLERAIH